VSWIVPYCALSVRRRIGRGESKMTAIVEYEVVRRFDTKFANNYMRFDREHFDLCNSVAFGQGVGRYYVSVSLGYLRP
jgi:hypothetical protein